MSTDLALAIEIQVEAQRAVDQLKGLQDQIQNLSNGLKDAGSGGAEAGESIFASMLKAQVVMEGLKMATSAVADAFKDILQTGIQFNAAMSQSALGIGTLVAAMSTIKDANGLVLQGQDALNAGMALGEKQVNALRVGSFQTVATLRQLTDAYQQGLGPMLAAGVSLDDTTKLTVKFAQAAGALGLDMTTLGHEMRATFSGQISPRITKIASSLQIKGEDIQKWKEAGTLVSELNTKLEFFGLAGEKVEASWKGVTSNLEHAFEAGSGNMTQPLFEALRSGIQEALGDAFNLTSGEFSEKFQGILDAGKLAFGSLGDLASTAMKSAVGAAESLATWFKVNRVEVSEIVTATEEIFVILGQIVGQVVGLAGSAGSALNVFTSIKLVVEGIGLVVAVVKDTLSVLVAGFMSVGTILLHGVLGPIQFVLLGIANIMSDPEGLGSILGKNAGDSFARGAQKLQDILNKGYKASNDLVNPLLEGKGAVAQFGDALLDAQAKAEAMGRATKDAADKTKGLHVTSNGPREKGDAKSAKLQAMEQENALLADTIRGMAHVTLAEQEALALAKVKLETGKELANIQKENEKHDDGTGKKVSGISDADAKGRRASALKAQVAANANIETEFAEKRKTAANELQNAMTAAEEGGLAKRYQAVESNFVKVRKLNMELGGTYTEQQIKAAEAAAMERARAEEIKEDVSKLKKELAELAQIRGGPLTDGELNQALANFAKKSQEAAEAAKKVREELHLDDTAQEGFTAGLREGMGKIATTFELVKTATASITKGISSSFATMFSDILTHGGTFHSRMDQLWKGLSSTVINALGQMAASKLVQQAIDATMATTWGAQAAAKLGIQAKDTTATTTATTNTLTAEELKTKAITGTAAAALASGKSIIAVMGEEATAATTAAGTMATAAASAVTAFGLETSAAMTTAAAEAWSAYSEIPFVGEGLALAQIASMEASVAATAAIPAFALGGRVDRATLGIMGEAGPEVIAPEASFLDYTKGMFGMGAALAANLGAHGRQVQNYQAASAGYGSGMASGSGGSGGQGGAGGGYVDLRGAVIAGESVESARIIGNLVKKGLDTYNKRCN